MLNKTVLKDIVDLIEDDRFPARRSITDYVLLLLPYEERKEADDYIESMYKVCDAKKKLMESKWHTAGQE